MLFWISSPDGADLGDFVERNIESFETLGLAGYAGQHFVIGDRPVMQELARTSSLSRRCKSYFSYVFSRYSELALMKRHVKFGTVISDQVVADYDVKNYVSLSHFARPSSCGEATLLAEHVFDYKVIRALAELWIARTGIAAVCKVSFRFAAGGGGGTGHVLSVYELDGSSIGCCIVDSDKSHAQDVFGSTAKFCMEVHNEMWRWDLHVLEARELENLIPTSLLHEATNSLVRPIPELYGDDLWSVGGYSDHKVRDTICRYLKDPAAAPSALPALRKVAAVLVGQDAACCGSGNCAEAAPSCLATNGHGGVLAAVVKHIEQRGMARSHVLVGALERMLERVVASGVALRVPAL